MVALPSDVIDSTNKIYYSSFKSLFPFISLCLQNNVAFRGRNKHRVPSECIIAKKLSMAVCSGFNFLLGTWTSKLLLISDDGLLYSMEVEEGNLTKYCDDHAKARGTVWPTNQDMCRMISIVFTMMWI